MSIQYKKLAIAHNLWIEHYDEEWGKGLSVNYIEPSYQWGFSDREEEVEIDKEKAIEIVSLLRNHFNIDSGA